MARNRSVAPPRPGQKWALVRGCFSCLNGRRGTGNSLVRNTDLQRRKSAAGQPRSAHCTGACGPAALDRQIRHHSSRHWRWLLHHLRQLCVDAGPGGRRRRPDRHCRLGEIRIVESANADEDQMRPCVCLAEERRPARRAESPVHLVATVRDTWIVAGLARHRKRCCTKASVNRSAAGTEILAHPAPAHTRDNRGHRTLPANCPTEAST